MAERPPPDATLLGRFLEQYSKDLEARVSRTLDDYLALFPGDSEHIAEEFLALRRFQEQGEQARSPAIPRQISHYRIVKEIGRGGQGVVYLAKDTKLGREVAIKMLRRSRLALEELERLQREARIASRLDQFVTKIPEKFDVTPPAPPTLETLGLRCPASPCPRSVRSSRHLSAGF